MSPQLPHTPAWKAYTYISFLLAVVMLGTGVFFAPIDIWIKGYVAMAAIFLTGSAFTLAKTLRDEQEANRLINKVEAAETDRLLRDNLPVRA